MVKNNKKSKKNLGKKNKKSHKKTLKKTKSCKSCNFIRFGRGSPQTDIKFGGCPDCGGSMVSGGGKGGKGSCGCKQFKLRKGGNHYPINTYNDDVSRAPFLKSSTLLGDFSRVSGGKRKSIKIHQYKKGGGILDFFGYPSNNYVTTHNTLGGVNTQRDILAGNALSNSDPRFQPVLNQPYGVTNPPLV
jgi:hypothetical protein